MLRSCGNTSTVLTIKYYRVDRVHSTYHLDTGVYQRQGRYRFTSSGIWLPFSISLLMYGRCTTTAFLVISLAGTASSNSKARTSVKTSAFILRDWVSHRNRDANEKRTDSTREKRYPMHDRGPPRKLIRFPHTPGTLCAASGTFSHRSGLNPHRQHHKPTRHTLLLTGTHGRPRPRGPSPY